MALSTFTLLCNHHHPSPGRFPSSQTEILLFFLPHSHPPHCCLNQFLSNKIPSEEMRTSFCVTKSLSFTKLYSGSSDTSRPQSWLLSVWGLHALAIERILLNQFRKEGRGRRGGGERRGRGRRGKGRRRRRRKEGGRRRSRKGPWLVWISGLSASLQTKGSLVQFPIRAHAWVAGQVPSWGCIRSNHTLMFLSLSFSLPSPLSRNK